MYEIIFIIGLVKFIDLLVILRANSAKSNELEKNLITLSAAKNAAFAFANDEHGEDFLFQLNSSSDAQQQKLLGDKYDHFKKLVINYQALNSNSLFKYKEVEQLPVTNEVKQDKKKWRCHIM